MRISDWSSDVCASDLPEAVAFCTQLAFDFRQPISRHPRRLVEHLFGKHVGDTELLDRDQREIARLERIAEPLAHLGADPRPAPRLQLGRWAWWRRVCPSVELPVVRGAHKQKHN